MIHSLFIVLPVVEPHTAKIKTTLNAFYVIKKLSDTEFILDII